MKPFNLLRLSFLIPLLLIPVPGLGQESISIRNIRINEAPPGINVTAGYFEIYNNNDTPVVLTGVTSPAFERVEMHRSSVKDGIAKMEKQGSITIPENSNLVFKQGDYHLMLYNPVKKLEKDEMIKLVFIFSDIDSLEATAMIREIGAGEEHHHHHH